MADELVISINVPHYLLSFSGNGTAETIEQDIRYVSS